MTGPIVSGIPYLKDSRAWPGMFRFGRVSSSCASRKLISHIVKPPPVHKYCALQYDITYNGRVYTTALGQESLIHQLTSLSHHKNIDTAFRATLRLRLSLSSVDYTTNIAW